VGLGRRAAVKGKRDPKTLHEMSTVRDTTGAEDESSVNEASGTSGVDANTSCNNTTSQQQSTQQPPQQIPAFLAGALQSLASGGQMFPTVDQNSVLMTNAAAAIAAVMSSMNQSTGVGGAPGVGVSPALLAALRSNGLVAPPPNNAAAAAQVASLLSAVSNGGAPLAGLTLPGSTGSLPANIQGQLQQLLNQVETNKLSTPSPSQPATRSHPSSALSIGPTMNSTPIAGMQGWSLKQLGESPSKPCRTKKLPNGQTYIAFHYVEQHVELLQRLQQPVPQTVALLLAEAQRKEKKKTAKRAANRKSASTSRARKKALVEEITRANARLKRQAMILALLPDLVIATTMEGEISFCSAQVERILGHSPDDLVGVNFQRILIPPSREVLQKLFSRIVQPTTSLTTRAPQGSRRGAKRRHDQKEGGDKSSRKDGDNSKEMDDGPGRESSSGDGNSGNSGTTSAAAIISEQSFPLAIVEVDSKQGPSTTNTKNSRLAANENSDNSTSNNSGGGSNDTSRGSKEHVSSLSNATGMSPTDSPDEDEGAGQADSKGSKRPKKGKRTDKSDDSSLSSEAKKASDNLDRNVRRHNQRMLDGSQKAQSDHGPKDDVTGESVTANNASARLSSLKHIPSPAPKKNDENDQSSSDDSLLAGVEEKKKVENQSDDSGYRESNDSREEESSSGSDSSNTKSESRRTQKSYKICTASNILPRCSSCCTERHKPLAPTARLCLIRADLSTIWCEVTSAMRQRNEEVDQLEIQLLGGSVDSDPPTKKEPPVQEFLLCLRPMRDGKKADKSMRIVSKLGSSETSGIPNVSTSGNDSSNTSKGKLDSEKASEDADSKNKSSASDEKEALKWSAKKRPVDSQGELMKESPSGKLKRTKLSTSGDDGPDDNHIEETAVIESLMLMNQK